MGASGGPDLNTQGLTTLIEVKDYRSIINNNTNFKLTDSKNSVSINERSFTLSSGIYDSGSKSFKLNGTDNSISIPNTPDNQFSWGSSISLLVSASAGSYILNEIDSKILYFTKNNKLTFLASPPSHMWNAYGSVCMTSNNEIILLGFRSNNTPNVLKLNLEGDIINMRRGIGTDFSYSYCYGKMIESSSFFYTPSFRGFSKTSNIFLNSYEKHTNNSTLNIYNGDMDIQDGYWYGAGPNYTEKAHMVEIENPLTNYAYFGSGNYSDDTGSLKDARGIAAGINYVFVSDTNNHRIMVLNKSNMTYHSHLGTTGNAGSSTDKFNSPQVCCTTGSYVYITDKGNNRIKVYNQTTLEYSGSFSTPNSQPKIISINNNGYMAIVDDSGKNLDVINLSNPTTPILQKTFISPSEGPGEYYQYSAKALRRSGSVIFSCDRNGTIREIFPSTLTFNPRVSHGEGDTVDLAIDDTHYYLVYENTIKKVSRSTNNTVSQITTNGSGEGEINSPRGLEVDDNYLYVADSGNHRIQIFNKSDLSFSASFGEYGSVSDGTNLNYPYSVTIDGGKLYVADKNNSKIRIYNTGSLPNASTSHSSSFSSSNPHKIRVYGDEIFSLNGDIIYVYNKLTGETKRYKDHNQGTQIGYIYSSDNLEVSEDKVFIQSAYHTSILDKETLEEERIFSPWYKCASIDDAITEDNILIDIVFTSNYKIKIFANGRESNEITYSSTHDFSTGADYIIGKKVGDYSNVELKRIAFYNRERTLEENTKEYKILIK